MGKFWACEVMGFLVIIFKLKALKDNLGKNPNNFIKQRTS
jgi:hypothetical protein